MRRIRPLVTGALIALGAMLTAVSATSASIPPEGQGSYTWQDYSAWGARGSGVGLTYSVVAYRAGVKVGGAGVQILTRTDSRGRHRKVIGIANWANRYPVDIHLRVDSGSSVVDYHTTPSTVNTNATWTRHISYSIRKIRLTLDGQPSPWYYVGVK